MMQEFFQTVILPKQLKLNDPIVYSMENITYLMTYQMLNCWLITPYKNYGNLTATYRKFNTKLSKIRVVISNTFGLLKGQW